MWRQCLAIKSSALRKTSSATTALSFSGVEGGGDGQTELRELGIEVDDKAKQWYIRYGDGERTASSYNVRGR